MEANADRKHRSYGSLGTSSTRHSIERCIKWQNIHSFTKILNEIRRTVAKKFNRVKMHSQRNATNWEILNALLGTNTDLCKGTCELSL